MVFRKALFLGILLFSNVAITAAAEQFQKEDFEAIVKRNYYDFLDRVGQEKFKELGLEDPVPLVAQGHEEIYQRFLNGVLIYRPNEGSDDGMVTLPIRKLANPLEGTFDLSRCGDAGNYLSISTGYRKEKKAENAGKVEIWFTPRFLIERELGSTAGHFKPIMDNWKQEQALVGMFWTLGQWDDLGWYDYLTNESMENLSKNDLYVWMGEGAASTAVGDNVRRVYRLYNNTLTWLHPKFKNKVRAFHVSWLS